MIPPFDDCGNLPDGVHWAKWSEFIRRFGGNQHRRLLLEGLKAALDNLKAAGCQTVYVDGSFITTKEFPRDFDACWEENTIEDPLKLDPILIDFRSGTALQKAKYYGELFPAGWREGISGLVFRDFFRVEKETGDPKGIVALDLRRLP